MDTRNFKVNRGMLYEKNSSGGAKDGLNNQYLGIDYNHYYICSKKGREPHGLSAPHGAGHSGVFFEHYKFATNNFRLFFPLFS